MEAFIASPEADRHTTPEVPSSVLSFKEDDGEADSDGKEHRSELLLIWRDGGESRVRRRENSC